LGYEGENETSMANPDPEIRSSSRVHNVVANSSTRPDLQIKIPHCKTYHET